MPPKNENAHTWTTTGQHTFLSAHYPEYLEIHNSRRPKYTGFWAKLNEAWFKLYPEIKSIFPDIASETDLSADQRERLTKAIQTRIDVLVLLFSSVHCY